MTDYVRLSVKFSVMDVEPAMKIAVTLVSSDGLITVEDKLQAVILIVDMDSILMDLFVRNVMNHVLPVKI